MFFLECCCRFFDVSKDMLPEIRSSAETYGNIVDGPLKGLPISGVIVISGFFSMKDFNLFFFNLDMRQLGIIVHMISISALVKMKKKLNT